LLAVRQLRVQLAVRAGGFWRRKVPLRAVEDVNFNLHAGETLGLVGESGSGKSTLARVLVGLQAPNSGAVHFDGRDLAALTTKEWRPLRREIQLIFQDPLASLSPRMRVAKAVAEPLKALYPEMSAAERAARAAQMLERVGIPGEHHRRFPHQFSGGQAQRIAIARALVVRPRLLICDEIVSALDASIQAQILDLLADLQRELGLAILFISHDLAVVRHISHRVMVMYFGRAMEHGHVDQIFGQPRHPYTRALLAALPGSVAPPEHRILEGELPSPLTPPPGCVFATRCPMADEQCARKAPHARRYADGGMAACHYAVDATSVAA
jgi:oligopeptide transport system ATP-binding protein